MIGKAWMLSNGTLLRLFRAVSEAAAIMERALLPLRPELSSTSSAIPW